MGNVKENNAPFWKYKNSKTLKKKKKNAKMKKTNQTDKPKETNGQTNKPFIPQAKTNPQNVKKNVPTNFLITVQAALDYYPLPPPPPPHN